jgi:flagellar hook assembly protein FlgD
VVKKFDDSPQHKPSYGKTLKAIAADACEDWVTWKHIALLNWGTVEPDEVVRAMAETVGIMVKGVFGPFSKLKSKPEDVKFFPDKDLPQEIRLPVKVDPAQLAVAKRHEIRVKRTVPAVGVAISALDKWFIPEIETCDIAYRFGGLALNADKAALDVHGSNYTRCTDFADGAGKYVADTANLEKIPLHTEKEGLSVAERGAGKLEWDGMVAPSTGVLKHTRDGVASRCVNVAFSPYTAHMRYWKNDADEKAHLQLMPFWPHFENTETELFAPGSAIPPAAFQPSAAAPTAVKFTYDNAEDADGGWLIVKDADGQVVWRRALKDKELKKGAGKILDWDGAYDKMARNGLMRDRLLNDGGKTQLEQDHMGLLFVSWPYTYEMKTYVRTYKKGAANGDPDPALIKWKVNRSEGLDRGLIQIFDKSGTLVWIKGLKKEQLADAAENSLQWDGKYSGGVENSKHGAVAIEADMPYRVQIQAHTKENCADGVALAAMHSEVRLYVPERQYARKDPRRSLTDTPQAMQISRAKHWPRSTPPPVASGDSDDARLYFQHELTKHGYHPGPVNGKANAHLTRAIHEFKRSVPKDVTSNAGDFTRHSLAPGDIDALSADMKDCIGSPALAPRWVRKIWGERVKIESSDDAPYYSDDADVDKALSDPKNNVVLWVDNRQYYTAGGIPGGGYHGYGPKGVDMLGNTRPGGVKLAGNDPDPVAADIAAAQDWGLRDYRDDMDIGDGAVDHDNSFVSSPWAPLKAELRLLSKKDDLHPEATDAAVKVDDGARRAAIRRAIGPLRVDWSVHDALYDVSPIDPATYPAGISPIGQLAAAVPEIRTRRHVAGALLAARRAHAAHTRPDEALPSRFWNCPKQGHDIGKVPVGLNLYHREVFADGAENALKPWFAKHDDTTEATASIVHDHIAEIISPLPNAAPFPQRPDDNLFEDLIGSAGIWFNPSIAGGDGYRLRAEVRFEDVGSDYKFPNNKVLAARYPVTPQAHTGEIRLWRRSVFRGYANWSPNAGADASRWTAETMRRMRAQFNVGHNYYTVDGYDAHGGVEKDIQTLLGNFGSADAKSMLRRLIKWHDGLTWDTDVAHADLHTDHLWPWSGRDDLGRPELEDYVGSSGDAMDDYVGEFDDFWDKLTGGILYWINARFEAHGHMRGHMMIDFKDSPRAKFYKYKCDVNGAHNFVGLRLGSAGVPAATACPVCAGTTTITLIGGNIDSINLSAIGLAIGSSWMFRGNIDDFPHEMGHHRHMEHASSAGGPRPAQHDSAPNPNVPAGADLIEDDNTNAQERQWDRRCVMSYNDRDASSKAPGNPDRPTLLFCGKCAMRIRGWKFGAIPNPGDDVREPA